MKRRLATVSFVVAGLVIVFIAILVLYLVSGKSYPINEFPTHIVGEWLIYPSKENDLLIAWVVKTDGTGAVKHYKRLESLSGDRFRSENDKKDNFFYRPWNTQVYYQPYTDNGEMEGAVIDKWAIIRRDLIMQLRITGFSLPWTYNITTLTPSDLVLDMELPVKKTFRLKRKELLVGN